MNTQDRAYQARELVEVRAVLADLLAHDEALRASESAATKYSEIVLELSTRRWELGQRYTDMYGVADFATIVRDAELIAVA